MKNRFFLFFIIIFIIFGVLLYDALPFTYTDELLTALLFIFSINLILKKRLVLNPTIDIKNLYILILIFLFYIIYSLSIHSNKPVAIFGDFTVQIKPFLGFICTVIITPHLNIKQKKTLKYITLISAILTFIITLMGEEWILKIFIHPSRQATAITIFSFLFKAV